jgi:DNA-binding response OmpR family regulator
VYKWFSLQEGFNMQGQILIVEDEEKIARILELELQHEGYTVQLTYDGKSALEYAQREPWDLILLDVMLPEMSGLEVLRRLRQEGSQVPVILLTARNAVPDKVSGLDLGANDYITKPFATEELLARIRNMLRMIQPVEEIVSHYHVDNLTIHHKSRKVLRDQVLIELTPREYDLLLYLVKHKGEVLTREQILREVWGYDYIGDTNVVDVYIRYLRKKVDKGFANKLIRTSRGIGYLLSDQAG